MGVKVCIGSFHGSGCLVMLPEIPSELKEAMDLGITLFAGEVESRLEPLLLESLPEDSEELRWTKKHELK